MLWSDTDTMLTTALRVPIGFVEQKLVDTTDLEYPHNGPARAAQDELAADARRALRDVHEAMDPGRVHEGQEGQIEGQRGWSPVDDLAENPSERLDGREVQLAVESDDDFGFLRGHGPAQTFDVTRRHFFRSCSKHRQ